MDIAAPHSLAEQERKRKAEKRKDTMTTPDVKLFSSRPLHFYYFIAIIVIANAFFTENFSLVGREVSLWRRIYVADAERSAFRGCSWQNSSDCLQSFSRLWIWCEGEEYRVVVCYTFSQPTPLFDARPPPARHPIWQRIYCFPFSRTQYIFFSHGNLVFQELWACVWTIRYSSGRGTTETPRHSFDNQGEESPNSSAFLREIQIVLTGLAIISDFPRISRSLRCRFPPRAPNCTRSTRPREKRRKFVGW